MTFSMPPEVSFRREQIDGCQTYVFRHVELGDLGRIVIQELPNGHSHISCEISGDIDDPMTEARRVVFEPISEQITNLMESRMGAGSMGDAETPASPQGNSETVATKLIPCDHCNENAALLIFADDAHNPGVFEDYARKLHHLYKRLDVPAWIIGPPVGELDESRTPTQVMKVWPTRKPIITLTADEFNASLDDMLDTHCQ